MRYETFIFFRDINPALWEKSLEELRKYDISYIILTRPFNLLTIAVDNDIASKVRKLIELAYKRFNIKSIITTGWSSREGSFIDENFVKRQLNLIIKGIEKLKDVEGLFAYYIDDEPYNTWNISPELVRDKYNDLFEKETGYRLPERGRVLGNWNYETALAYCDWLSSKYLGYLKRIIQEYKRILPHVKSTVTLHMDAIFPSANNPVNVQRIIDLIDIVMTDIYPGWHLIPQALDHIVSFQIKFLRDITDKPLWVILQCHRIMLGYAPTFQQIEKWTYDAIESGCDAIGWYACDHNYAFNIRVKLSTEPTKYACKERWYKALEISKKISELNKRKIGKFDVAIFVSMNSILSYGWLQLFYSYVTLCKDVGLGVDFITDEIVLQDPEILENYSRIYLGSAVSLNEKVAELLINYVRKGGVIIGRGLDLMYDDRGKKCDIRRKLFGIINEKYFWNDESIILTNKLSTLARNIASLKGFWERIAITRIANSAEALGLWSNSLPAIIMNRIGKGKAIYIGTMPYLANCMRGEKTWAKFIKTLDMMIKE